MKLQLIVRKKVDLREREESWMNGPKKEEEESNRKVLSSHLFMVDLSY